MWNPSMHVGGAPVEVNVDKMSLAESTRVRRNADQMFRAERRTHTVTQTVNVLAVYPIGIALRYLSTCRVYQGL